MTSSVHDLSEGSGPNEQQKQSQPEIQSQSPANGNIQPGMATRAAEYVMPRHLDMAHTMAQAAYPYIDPYYGGIVAAYGGQSMIHPHLMGVFQPGLPLQTDALEEPVYVNAKQYHGILRRRQSRAKAESENKVIKSRKPYLHESRHLHALKRARGCGGRFLNSKSKGDQQQANAEPCNGPTSESTCSNNQQTEVPSDGREQEAKAPGS